MENIVGIFKGKPIFSESLEELTKSVRSNLLSQCSTTLRTMRGLFHVVYSVKEASRECLFIFSEWKLDFCSVYLLVLFHELKNWPIYRLRKTKRVIKVCMHLYRYI